ncbi:hypothetical protein ACFSTD_21145 [Novosphingobium colocasiae]
MVEIEPAGSRASPDLDDESQIRHQFGAKPAIVMHVAQRFHHGHVVAGLEGTGADERPDPPTLRRVYSSSDAR